MKKYLVKVNGTSYEVEIEEMTAGEAEKAPESKKAAPAASNGEKVTSPMPGTVVSVAVSEGAAVKKGSVLLVLEAMKMENEILAPCDGTVRSLSVSKGMMVKSGDLFCVIA